MTSSADTVVLVHGLWVHGMIMEPLRRRVARRGYRALCYSYPTVRLTLAENVERLERYCSGISGPRLHFIGHSLGGLVVLRMLARARGLPPGRVVLMGTPYGECHAARRLARLPGGRSALGRSMLDWLQGPRPELNGGHPVGVIAGRFSLGLGRMVAPDLPLPNDGAVNVEETRFPGMRDHVILDVSHSGMLFSPAVARQVDAFLGDGAFEHA